VEEIAREHGHLGTFGAGILAPEFEERPAAALEHFLPMLALRTVSFAVWSNNVDDRKHFPWGAGLCVRREVTASYARLLTELRATAMIDRRGQMLFSGGDDLFSWSSVHAGLGFGIFPELRVSHLIAADRLKLEYFTRLMRGHGYSHGLLNYLLTDRKPQRLNLSRKARLIMHGLRRGYASMRCNWAHAEGEEQAARLIAESAMRPVNFVRRRRAMGEWGCSAMAAQFDAGN
jgi:hypothetical protein